jgi:hypothetical protein
LIAVNRFVGALHDDDLQDAGSVRTVWRAIATVQGYVDQAKELFDATTPRPGRKLERAAPEPDLHDCPPPRHERRLLRRGH